MSNLYLYPHQRIGYSAGGQPDATRRVPFRGGPPERHVLEGLDDVRGRFLVRRPRADDDPRSILPPGSGPPLEECEVVEERSPASP